jgi:hypothetical protein
MDGWIICFMLIYLFGGVCYLHWLCKRTARFAGTLLHDHERRLKALELQQKGGAP